MPPKKGKGASKKKIPRTSTEDEDLQINQIDVHYNPEIVSSLLHDLSLQIESKCNQIQKDSDFMITSIQQAFHLELIKLPNQVKQMSIREFKEEYGGDILNVTKGYTQQTLVKSSKSSSVLTVSNKANIQKERQKVFQTPNAIQKKSKNGMLNAMRNPREGEIILSANGSPLGGCAIVKKEPQNGSKIDSFVPQTPGVFLPLRNGNIIDLDTVDIHSLSKEEKEDIQTYLRTVSKNIEGIASKLKLQSS